MEELQLVPVTASDVKIIAEYCAAFPESRMRVTFEENRIPGLDYLEEYDNIADWLQYTSLMCWGITWFKTIRCSDGKMVGAVILRHDLQYDDDDPEFASHIGYSVRPDERRKGYAKAQLRLALEEARKIGLETVRIVCVDYNIGSRKTIEACGGVLRDSIRGEESGLEVLRFDVAAG